MLPSEVSIDSVRKANEGLALTELPVRQLDEHCQRLLAHHSKTFSLAAIFLNEEQRRDAAIAYAFCRLVDDAVDEATCQLEAEAQLLTIEQMLLGKCQATALVAAYLQLSERAQFGLTPALDLIRGARTDLGRVRVNDEVELLRYCYRVAGTVGLMMCGILGVTDRRAFGYAVDLGVAMQLTNIARDVLEDARRNRVYLPATFFPSERPGVARSIQEGIISWSDPAAATLTERTSPALRLEVTRAVERTLTLADHRYSSAKHGYRFLPPRARLAIVAAARLYREIGVVMRNERDCDALRGRVAVPTARKFLLLVWSMCFWLKGLIRSTPDQVAVTPSPLPLPETKSLQ